MLRRPSVASVLIIAALAPITGCGGDGDSVEEEPAVFIAFEREFQDYHRWTSYAMTDGADQGLAHLAGMRTVYVNRLPHKGAATFPVGTIVVKELGASAVAERSVFAMVKRGGGFNTEGALGWEWFELHNQSDGTVTILWRGVGPPDGEKYGGDPAAGGCNECHGTALMNDFVRSVPLQLGR